MAWFTKKATSGPTGPADRDDVDPLAVDDDAMPVDDAPLVIPRLLPLDDSARRRIAVALAALAADGVDVDDLASLADAYDRTWSSWAHARLSGRESHDVIVERFGIGIAEHLSRTTDLTWGIVSDAFGTEIGVGSAEDGDLLVPTNLVAVRWMNGETGWVTGVVTTIKRRRGHR
jgi:hypothetical protein